MSSEPAKKRTIAEVKRLSESSISAEDLARELGMERVPTLSELADVYELADREEFLDFILPIEVHKALGGEGVPEDPDAVSHHPLYAQLREAYLRLDDALEKQRKGLVPL